MRIATVNDDVSRFEQGYKLLNRGIEQRMPRCDEGCRRLALYLDQVLLEANPLVAAKQRLSPADLTVAVLFVFATALFACLSRITGNDQTNTGLTAGRTRDRQPPRKAVPLKPGNCSVSRQVPVSAEV